MTAFIGNTARGNGEPMGRALVCLSTQAHRAQLRGVLAAGGFDVIVEVSRGLELLPHVADVMPDLVVLDLALVGSLGLRLFRLIHTLAPDAAIVALAPLPSLGAAAEKAGAYACVPLDDPRRLRAVLDGLKHSSHR